LRARRERQRLCLSVSPNIISSHDGRAKHQAEFFADERASLAEQLDGAHTASCRAITSRADVLREQ
jgi:hypothetical protein